MKTIKLAMVAVALLAAVSATSFAQGRGRGGGGGGTAAGGGGGGARGAGGGNVVGGFVVPRTVTGLFVGTSAASDSIVIAQAMKVDAKYAADIRAGRVTRAGPPADSLVEKARVATGKRNEELRALLKSDDDKKKFDENLVAMTAGRGGL
jgi:hypothetical protein